MTASAMASWLASLQLVGAALLGLGLMVDRFAHRFSARNRRGIWALTIMIAATLPFARLVLAGPAWTIPSGLAAAILVVWSLGAGLLGLRWAHGLASTSALLASSSTATSEPWRRSLAELDRTAIAVELRESTAITGPMLIGWTRPVILIPKTDLVPSAAERRAILIHELAHLRGVDNLLLHLGAVVRALYWITPLAWLGARRLRETCETAADDAVLSAGTPATRYAAQLVASARANLDRAGWVTAGALRERVEAILDGSRQRAPLPTRRPSLAVARLVAVAVLLASVATACEARSEAVSGAPTDAASTNTPASDTLLR